MNLLFNKYDKKITFFSIILLMLVIFMIVISVFYKFNFHFSYNGIVFGEEGEYYVYVLLSDNDIVKIKKVFLVVDKCHVSYKIFKISDEYILTDIGPKRGVYLKFDLNDDDKIVNNVISLNFVYESTLFNKLKEMF